VQSLVDRGMAREEIPRKGERIRSGFVAGKKDRGQLVAKL
jgi:hypothetical protein